MSETELEKKLSDLINSESREDDSNTPDHILAEFMMNCLDAFELASNRREGWYGITSDVLNNWEELIMAAIDEASMCWSEAPKGVFDSAKAAQICKKLSRSLSRLKDITSGPKKPAKPDEKEE